jgi:hypothetical protein
MISQKRTRSRKIRVLRLSLNTLVGSKSSVRGMPPVETDACFQCPSTACVRYLVVGRSVVGRLHRRGSSGSYHPLESDSQLDSSEDN